MEYISLKTHAVQKKNLITETLTKRWPGVQAGLATAVTRCCQTLSSALQGTLAVTVHPQCGVTHPSRSQGKEPISRKAYRAFIESETKLIFG